MPSMQLQAHFVAIAGEERGKEGNKERQGGAESSIGYATGAPSTTVKTETGKLLGRSYQHPKMERE